MIDAQIETIDLFIPDEFLHGVEAGLKEALFCMLDKFVFLLSEFMLIIKSLINL